MRNRKTNKTTRVSVNWRGKQLKGGNVTINTDPEISMNGAWVAFESAAKNVLKGGKHPGTFDHVYVRNLNNGKIKLVSRRGSKIGNDESDNPELTAKGEFVAFETRSTNLIPGGDANGSDKDVFRRGRLY